MGGGEQHWQAMTKTQVIGQKKVSPICLNFTHVNWPHERPQEFVWWSEKLILPSEICTSSEAGSGVLPQDIFFEFYIEF